MQFNQELYDKCSYDVPRFKFPLDVVLEMETGDPDDYFALLLCLNEKFFNLKAVTICPGSKDQVGLVKAVISSYIKKYGENKNRIIPVGSFDPNHKLKLGRSFWSQLKYSWKPEKPDGLGCDIINEVFTSQKEGEIVIITCGPVKNLGKAIKKYPKLEIPFWWAQGGFAGDNVVAKEDRMKKFEGLITMGTYNFNGSKKSVLEILESKRVKQIVCTSKNCCHRVIYDKKVLHKKVGIAAKKNKSPTLKQIFEGMSCYKKKEKKFHDPLAVLCLINPEICLYKKVSIEFKKGKKGGWGSKLKEESDTAISVKVDLEKFEKTLLEM